MIATKPEMLYLRQLTLGPMKNFIYLVGSAGSTEATVIDPAWDVEAIDAALKEDGKTLSAIWLSHHHPDHVNGVEALLKRHDVPVYVQSAEYDFAESVRFGDPVEVVKPGQTLQLSGLSTTSIFTPGHTPGSQCLSAGGALFSGDTLFVDHCGRCDFHGSDPRQMFESLHHTLGKLPADTVLYPGHDYGVVKVSTLERERKENKYYQADTEAKFLVARMGPAYR